MGLSFIRSNSSEKSPENIMDTPSISPFERWWNRVFFAGTFLDTASSWFACSISVNMANLQNLLCKCYQKWVERGFRFPYWKLKKVNYFCFKLTATILIITSITIWLGVADEWSWNGVASVAALVGQWVARRNLGAYNTERSSIGIGMKHRAMLGVLVWLVNISRRIFCTDF